MPSLARSINTLTVFISACFIFNWSGWGLSPSMFYFSSPARCSLNSIITAFRRILWSSLYSIFNLWLTNYVKIVILFLISKLFDNYFTTIYALPFMAGRRHLSDWHSLIAHGFQSGLQVAVNLATHPVAILVLHLPHQVAGHIVHGDIIKQISPHRLIRGWCKPL